MNNIYGDGYEEATEPGPDVECKHPIDTDDNWYRKTVFNTILCSNSSPFTMDEQIQKGWIYRRPIKQLKEMEAYDKMVKQKAENEIKLWDIEKVKKTGIIFLITQSLGKEFSTDNITWHRGENLEKVTGTPEFMSELRAVLERK